MTQKITMGRDRRQDAIDAENAMRQSGNNAYVSGIQRPVGDQVAASRSRFGAPTVMPQTITEGPNSNFAAVSTTANMPLDNPIQTTGSTELQTSATKITETDPEQFQADAMDEGRMNERLEMYSKAAGNAGYSLNDRANTGRI